MSKGRKQAVTLILLCVLLAAACCLYYFVPKGDTEEVSETDTEAINVVNVDPEQITSVHISGDEEITLSKTGEDWKLKELPDAPINAETVESMLASLHPVTATKEMDVAQESLAEYGLEQPIMSISISTEDGASYELKLGDTVPVSGGNYGLSGASEKMYTFPDTLYSAFHVEKNSLISMENIADINADYLMGISIKSGKKDTFKAEVVSDDKRVDAYTNWIISEPYEKPLAGSSTESWNTLQGYFTSLTFNSLVEYGCSDWKKYGLKNPAHTITVQYFELKEGYEVPEETANPEKKVSAAQSTNQVNKIPKKYQNQKSYTLYLGDRAEDGSYYARLSGSDQVYLLAAETAESMIGADAYTYMDHSVYSTLATDLKGYEIQLGDSGKKIKVTHTTQKGEDGKDKNVWTLNGKKVTDEEEEAFLTPYSKMYLLEFTSQAKDSVKPVGDKPVLTAICHEEGRDVTIRYYPYDGTNFYRVNKDGMDYFLVDKLSVDDVIQAFDGLSDS